MGWSSNRDRLPVRLVTRSFLKSIIDVRSDEHSASLRILRALADPPSSAQPLAPSTALHSLFASLVFTSLIRSSTKCKTAAHAIIPSHLLYPGQAPASGTEDDDEEPPPSLLATLMGSVALALRSRSQARDTIANAAAVAGAAGAEPVGSGELTEWDRVIVGYLSVLCFWCWDDPQSVREVLDEGGALGVVG